MNLVNTEHFMTVKQLGAIQITNDVKEVPARKKFNLLGWVSNRPSFTKSLQRGWEPKTDAEATLFLSVPTTPRWCLA